MIKSEHRAIFSTPLGAYELAGISDELKLAEYIESKIEVGDDVTQTHWTLHEDPTLEPFIVKLKECIEHFINLTDTVSSAKISTTPKIALSVKILAPL